MPCSRATRRSRITLRAATGYIVGSPSIATVTITSDDVAPDLTVSALTAPAKAAPGGTIAVTDTTRNQGTGAGPASQTSFYPLARRVPRRRRLAARQPTCRSAGGGRRVDSHGVGDAARRPRRPAPTSCSPRRTGRPNVTEVNETNNHRASAISVGPDLLVTSFTAPAAAAPGSAIAVSDTTRTRGPRRRLHRSRRSTSRPTWCSMPVTSFWARVRLAALAAGGTSTAGTTVTLPATLATGTYYLIAQADGGAAIAELNEMNNGKASAIRIGPDLVVSSFSAPIRAAAGGTIAVTETTANSGSGPAAASTTAFYLSLNLTVEPGDVRLGPGRPVPPLAAWPVQHGDDDPDAAAGGAGRLVRPGQCRRRRRRDRNAGNEQRPFRQRPDRSGSDVRLRHFAERRGRGQHDHRIDDRA